MQTKILRVELHCHTEFSHDGHIQRDGLMEMAKRRRLDVIAITDHDTIAGALEYRGSLRRAGADLRIIVGEERTLADGTHVIGLFLREPLHSNTLQSAHEEITAQGGLCVVPHPYRAANGALRAGDAKLRSSVCFEVFNPKCSHDENRAARGLAERGWLAVGGSDAHFESDVAQCVNLVPFHLAPESSVWEALAGRAPVCVIGVHQRPGDQGRRYAPQPLRALVPQALKPAAAKAFHSLRNTLQKRQEPQLELKCGAGPAGPLDLRA